jgi:hypothetical protein
MKKEIYSGLGLGLLVGIVIGLSISEVTGIILGALTSLLAAFFGLRSTKEGETIKNITIGTFSLACFLAIFLGIYLRVHNSLSPSIDTEIENYKKVKFDDNEIKKIILFKTLGIVPEGSAFSKEAKSISSTSLMANDEMILCNSVNDKSTLEEVKGAFDDAGLEYKEIETGLSKRIHNSEELRLSLIFLSQEICKKQK